MLLIIFFSPPTLIQATATIVTRKGRGGNQSAQAALGQTCCYATEHFDTQEQRLPKVKYAGYLEKQKEKKKGRYPWVIAGGILCNLRTAKLWGCCGSFC